MITISIFSGKCDLADTIDIQGADYIISKYKIYDYRNILPLEVKEPKDLIPYYPYLVTLMYSNKETGGVIRLSKESFVDSEERQHIQWEMDEVKKHWRRSKRKKEEFDKEEVLNRVFWLSHFKDYQIEIVDRVEKFGDKATIEGLHDLIHDHYRKKLFNKMVNNGWNRDEAGSWIYGLLRWNKEIKNE